MNTVITAITINTESLPSPETLQSCTVNTAIIGNTANKTVTINGWMRHEGDGNEQGI